MNFDNKYFGPFFASNQDANEGGGTTTVRQAVARAQEAEERARIAEQRAAVAEERQRRAEARAQEIERGAITQETPISYKVYTNFTADDVVQNINERITDGIFTGGTGSITTFFTSSTQSSSFGDYYYNVYSVDPAVDNTATVQFAVTYGNRNGGGAPAVPDSNEPTKAIFSQYRNLLLNQTAEKFTFAGSVTSDDIYVINFQRNRLKLKMDVGNWELILVSGSTTIKLIDDSLDTIDINAGNAGRVYNVVSGTLNLDNAADPVINTAAANEVSGGYGLFYPDLGLIVLNPAALTVGLGLVTDVTSGSLKNNHGNFFDKLNKFTARNEEIVTSTHYFVRAKNRDYNFSINPSFYSGSEGEFRHKSMVGNPKVYITTVGLYNTSNQLLAVAKLSAPVQKAFDKEVLVKVKLDF